MDKSTIRKIIEDRIVNLSGDSFQDFCDSVCIKLYPNDYTPVRAGGPKGDMKNDGYCPKAKIFFQAHASRGEAIYKIKAKIEKDLKGCKVKHLDMNQWNYLTNDTLVGEIQTFVDTLRPQYPGITIETWDHKILADKIERLTVEEIESILGVKLSADSQFTNIQSSIRDQIGIQNNYYAESQIDDDREPTIIDEIFKDVINKIDLQNLQPYKDRHMIHVNEKIKLNFKTSTEQDTVQRYFSYALSKVKKIEERIQLEETDTQNDIHAHMFSKYNELKRKNLSNTEIMEQLFTDFVPLGKNHDPQYTNLTRAFILFFFDDCTIFEKTESEKQTKLFEN